MLQKVSVEIKRAGGLGFARDLTRLFRAEAYCPETNPHAVATQEEFALFHEITLGIPWATVYHPLMPEWGPFGWQQQLMWASDRRGRPSIEDNEILMMKVLLRVDQIITVIGKGGKEKRLWKPHSLRKLLQELAELHPDDRISLASLSRLPKMRSQRWGGKTWEELLREADGTMWPKRRLLALLANQPFRLRRELGLVQGF
jgi:hypothetical protein